MKTKARLILLFTLFLFLFTFFISYIAIPKEISVIKGKDYIFDIKSPFNVEVNKTGSIKTNKSFNLGSPLLLNASENGNYFLNFNLMGFFPVKASINVIDETYVYPSGESCGVKILTDGILIISISDVSIGNGNIFSPAKLAGLLPGDFIKEANGKKIKNTKEFINLVRNNKNAPIKLKYLREGKLKSTIIIPVKSTSGDYVLGLWARDSTAGLGTLTFYTGDKKSFGALGHSITDTDTGEVMSVKNGDLVKSKIISVKKGKKGNAGELTGIFEEPSIQIGKVEKNCEFGLFGSITNEEAINSINPVPVGVKSEVKTGKAKIITTLKDNIPREFEAEIIKLNKHSSPDIKGIVLKITDPTLLKETGGIVQGMSGSPILQNGKIVGAVTHVFVNDPTRGYGIFIENMLAEAE